MHRKYFFTILFLVLCSFFLIAMFFIFKPVAGTNQDVQFKQSPYHNFISGTGSVEPKSGNIYVGVPFNRIVKKIYVSVNERVKKGDLLFQLDNQDLMANLRIKQEEYESALASLHKLQALPRKEDLSVSKALLKKGQISFDEAKAQYDMVLNLPTPGAISKEERDRRLYGFQAAEAALKEAEAEFAKTASGTWDLELKIAETQVALAKANVEAMEAEIDRTSIKSPIDGSVLQIAIREGETPGSDPSSTVMILGNIDQLYLRVSVDQFDISLIHPDAGAVAYRQGTQSVEYPLEFIHVEPFMAAKKYVTNAVAEKIDTQVLEIMYRIAKNDPPLFIGEQMDVFIDAKEK